MCGHYIDYYSSNSRRHSGGLGKNKALLPSRAGVQVAVLFPISSNPSLHVYVAISPVELPVKVAPPFVGFVGAGHVAIIIL